MILHFMFSLSSASPLFSSSVDLESAFWTFLSIFIVINYLYLSFDHDSNVLLNFITFCLYVQVLESITHSKNCNTHNPGLLTWEREKKKKGFSKAKQLLWMMIWITTRISVTVVRMYKVVVISSSWWKRKAQTHLPTMKTPIP